MFGTAERTIERFNLIKQGDRIVAAVSGGPDSMALLFFLNSIKEKYGAELFAVHVNHMLRGEEAERDACFVRDYCERSSIELHVVYKNVSDIAATKKISIEEAGRNARFEAYGESLSRFSANKIATGHNKNDNAETFLLRLSRGAGAKGLSGIPPKSVINGITVIRPLINSAREQIESFCNTEGIPFITDSTNAEDYYSRNKVRLSLLPWLKQNMNNDIVNTLTTTSEILREQTEFIERIAKRAYEACLLRDGVGFAELNTEAFLKNEPAIKKLIVREALEKAGGSLKDISSVHIDDILALSEKGTGKTVCLPGGMLCKTRYGTLVFGKDMPSPAFSYELTPCQPVYVKEEGVFVTFSSEQLKLDNLKILCTKMFKCDRILFKLYYRTRLPGDRIKLPCGTKKLSDYFIDTKTPVGQRGRTALIADGRDILSIMGVCDSEYVKCGENEFYLQIWEDTNGNNTSDDTPRKTLQQS